MRKGASIIAFAALTAILAGCGGAPKRGGSIERMPGSGGYYLDDGPGANAPADIDATPDAVPKVEPLSRGTMRPYVVMGRSYTPMTRLTPYKARGIASWYGRRYHGKQTSSGEIYDMYAMSAAHTVLPIPSYARVTNVSNGKSVVVRVNDRGPFIDNRLIDLSYTAAHKLGIIGAGSGMVEVESIIPGSTPAPEPPPAVASAPTAVPATVETPPLTAVPLPPPDPAPPAPVIAAAPPAAVVTTPPAAAPAPAAAIYLQFGAFGVQANAESFLAKLQVQLGTAAGTLGVQSRNGIFRVRGGPFASDAMARAAAERAGQVLGSNPIVVSE